LGQTVFTKYFFGHNCEGPGFLCAASFFYLFNAWDLWAASHFFHSCHHSGLLTGKVLISIYTYSYCSTYELHVALLLAG